MPAADGSRDEEGKGEKPEKLLNGFVRCIALIERLGNALGTLAFTWATVVLLGGYPTVLRPKDDFWFATAIVFLEAARMFSRNNRLDYQLFFNTRGAFRPLGWNGLILVELYTSVLVYIVSYFPVIGIPILMVVSIAVCRFLLPGLTRLFPFNLGQRHTVSVWSSLLPIVFLGLSVLRKMDQEDNHEVKLVMFILMFAVLLFLAISTLKFSCITKLVGSAQNSNKIFCHRVTLNSCMVVTGVMLVFMFGDPYDRLFLILFEVSAVVILSLGNLQIPAAIVRVVLALIRLRPHYYYSDDEKIDYNDLGEKTNLAPSLNIFYGMVLAQGTFYGVACMLELFSFVPRRSLVRRAGFKGQWGLDSVNMYYAYALDKCMEKDVLAPKKISLVSFAMDSLKLDSTKRQFHGIRMLHSLLQLEPARIHILSTFDASANKINRIIRMLEWTRADDATIRLFATKVFCEIAKSFRLATIPGTVQVISKLLDCDIKPERENMFLDTDDENEGRVADTTNIQERQGSVHDTENQGELGQEQVHPDKCILLEIQGRSNQQAGINEQKCCILRCWKLVTGFWSIPEEEPLTDQDVLPALGMSMLCNLAYYDQDNCMVISTALDLIPKIIWFTSDRNSLQNTSEAQREILMAASLKLLRKLSNINGEIGITLRRTITKHPILLSNLTEILCGSFSSQELRKHAVGILRNLAIDSNIGQEIGSIQIIVSHLTDAFLSRAVHLNTNWDPCMQKVAGQALVMLTMESVVNFEAMPIEPGNLIGELASMICEGNHTYVAAKLLQNLFLHIQPELSGSDLSKLCAALHKVLETCMDANTQGAELEVLVGLSSQICKVIPEDFSRELEKCQGTQSFVIWLVETLKAYINPAIHCPGIRRAVIEQAIHLMKYRSRYASLFNQYGMIDVLSRVKHTPSRVDRYKIFMGNVGLKEHKEPLINLVATAEALICRQWLQSTSNVG